MKPKKSPKVNVELKRSLFSKIGFAISISLMIVAFTWTTYDETEVNYDSDLILTPEEDMIYLPPDKKKKEEIIHHVIKAVENNSIDSSNTDMFKVDIKPTDSFVIRKIIDYDSIEPTFGDEVFIIVEKNPVFPDGELAMLKYIVNNIEYPELELQNGIQGLVVVSFIVETDGNLSTFKILQGVSSNINNEAIRVLKSMPKWKPGKQRGKAVRVSINMPIRFTLSD